MVLTEHWAVEKKCYFSFIYVVLWTHDIDVICLKLMNDSNLRLFSKIHPYPVPQKNWLVVVKNDVLINRTSLPNTDKIVTITDIRGTFNENPAKNHFQKRSTILFA